MALLRRKWTVAWKCWLNTRSTFGYCSAINLSYRAQILLGLCRFQRNQQNQHFLIELYWGNFSSIQVEVQQLNFLLLVISAAQFWFICLIPNQRLLPKSVATEMSDFCKWGIFIFTFKEDSDVIVLAQPLSIYDQKLQKSNDVSILWWIFWSSIAGKS